MVYGIWYMVYMVYGLCYMVYYNTYCIYYHDSLRSIVTSILTLILLPPLPLKPEPIPINHYTIYEPIRIRVSPSSKGSVILMLIIVLMMEGPRRGLFYGK